MRRKLKKVVLFLAGLILMSVMFSCKKSKTPTPAPPAPTPPASLVAYWPLDGTADDKSLYGHSGVASGVTPTTDRFNKANGALHFDGQTSFIMVADKADLRLGSTDFTLNAWVKLDAYSSDFVSTIISKRQNGVNGGWLWAINGAGNAPKGAIYYGPGGGSTNAIGNMALSVGQWYMVTCVYTVSNSVLQIYVNGTLDKQYSGISPANANTAVALTIGKDTANGDAYFFNGSLDEIKIYNIALSQSDITKFYTAANGL